jgi:DNA-binding PadR family transcriptional regulator
MTTTKRGTRLEKSQVDFWGELTQMITLALSWGAGTTVDIRNRVSKHTNLSLDRRNIYPLMERLERYGWISKKEKQVFSGESNRWMYVWVLTATGRRVAKQYLERLMAIGAPLIKN